MTELVMRLPALWRQGLDGLRSVYGLILLIPAVILVLDPVRLEAILTTAAEALAGTLPYLIFAVLLFAWLRATGAEAIVARAFQGRETRMILLAALFGGLAPFCSCEVIPFIAGLLAMGVPLSAVMAFWLSSPLIDPPSLLITASALGWPFAIAKTIGAVALGLLGGFGTRLLISAGPVRRSTPRQDIRRLLRRPLSLRRQAGLVLLAGGRIVARPSGARPSITVSFC